MNANAGHAHQSNAYQYHAYQYQSNAYQYHAYQSNAHRNLCLCERLLAALARCWGGSPSKARCNGTFFIVGFLFV